MTDVTIDRDPSTVYPLIGDRYKLFYTLQGTTGDQWLVVIRYPRLFAIAFDSAGTFRDLKSVGCPEQLQTLVERNGVSQVLCHLTEHQLSELIGAPGCKFNPIRVRKFFLGDHTIGITDFPESFLSILRHPEQYAEDDFQLAHHELDRWSQEGLFVLWLDQNRDLWMTSDGEVESS